MEKIVKYILGPLLFPGTIILSGVAGWYFPFTPDDPWWIMLPAFTSFGWLVFVLVALAIKQKNYDA